MEKDDSRRGAFGKLQRQSRVRRGSARRGDVDEAWKTVTIIHSVSHTSWTVPVHPRRFTSVVPSVFRCELDRSMGRALATTHNAKRKRADRATGPPTGSCCKVVRLEQQRPLHPLQAVLEG